MGQDNGKLCVIHACLLLTLYVLFDCILLAIIPYLGNCFSDNNNNLNIWFFCRNICKPDVCPDPTDEKQPVFSSRSLYETPLVHFSCPWVSYVLLHPPSCRLVRHAVFELSYLSLDFRVAVAASHSQDSRQLLHLSALDLSSGLF